VNKNFNRLTLAGYEIKAYLANPPEPGLGPSVRIVIATPPTRDKLGFLEYQKQDIARTAWLPAESAVCGGTFELDRDTRNTVIADRFARAQAGSQFDCILADLIRHAKQFEERYAQAEAAALGAVATYHEPATARKSGRL